MSRDLSKNRLHLRPLWHRWHIQLRCGTGALKGNFTNWIKIFTIYEKVKCHPTPTHKNKPPEASWLQRLYFKKGVCGGTFYVSGWEILSTADSFNPLSIKK
jgi:hypothetical protein